MLFREESGTGLSRVSVLFVLSYAILLALGTFSMAFANFMLGFILFVLGLALVIGNEYLVFRKIERKARAAAFSPSNAISELLHFTMLSYILPSAVALFLFFVEGWGTEVLVVSVAGFTATSVKVAAKTAQLFFAK